jgi:hypothetical protein
LKKVVAVLLLERVARGPSRPSELRIIDPIAQGSTAECNFFEIFFPGAPKPLIPKGAAWGLRGRKVCGGQAE